MEVHPWHAEHSPCANRFCCSLPSTFAAAKLNTIVVHVVARWHCGGRRSDLRVREACVLHLRNEASNIGVRWCRQAEHVSRSPQLFGSSHTCQTNSPR